MRKIIDTSTIMGRPGQCSLGIVELGCVPHRFYEGLESFTDKGVAMSQTPRILNLNR